MRRNWWGGDAARFAIGLRLYLNLTSSVCTQRATTAALSSTAYEKDGWRDEMAGGTDLLALNDLLHGSQEEQDEREQAGHTQGKVFTPGDFGPPRITEKPTKSQTSRPADPKAIWNEHEAQEQDGAFYDPDDKRPQPEYDFVYKQSVMTEDTFLGMAGKTPGSQDCTHIVVKVVFPGCRMSDLEVDVTKQSFLAASPQHRLATYLPLPVDDTKGVAKWDAGNETLSVTLPIVALEW